MMRLMTVYFYTSKILKRRWLSDNAFEIILSRPNEFEFTAGQRICLLYNDIDRDYSMVSAPADAHVALCIRHVQGGAMSTALSAAKIGTRIKFSGPHGYFTFQSMQPPAMFVATGTGIAPFRSMLRAGISEFTLLHGVRKVDQLYYSSEFKSGAKRYVPCISEKTKKFFAGFQGRVTDYLETQLPPGVYDFYLCGRREMIRDVILLADERFPGSRIFTEIFY